MKYRSCKKPVLFIFLFVFNLAFAEEFALNECMQKARYASNPGAAAYGCLALAESISDEHLEEYTESAGFIAKTKSDIRAISSSVKLFKLDNSKYPTALSELVSGSSTGRGYLDKVPKDPWGNEYQYAGSGSHLEFDIWSFGADGTSGGADAGQDIGNWNMDEIK